MKIFAGIALIAIFAGIVAFQHRMAKQCPFPNEQGIARGVAMVLGVRC